MDKCQAEVCINYRNSTPNNYRYDIDWNNDGDYESEYYYQQDYCANFANTEIDNVAVRVQFGEQCIEEYTVGIQDYYQPLTTTLQSYLLDGCFGYIEFTATTLGGKSPYRYYWDLNNDGDIEDITSNNQTVLEA